MAYSQRFPLATPQSSAAKDLSCGPDLTVRLICLSCRDPDSPIVEELGIGELVCGDCGLVLGDRIVDTEWRTFANDGRDVPSRFGAASNPPTEQLGSVIGCQDGTAHGLRFAASLQESRSVQKILYAFRDISHWCHQFSLPKTITDLAKQLYRRSYEKKLLRRKPLDAIIAACIFVSCRQLHAPRTFREICDVMHVSKKMLGHCYKALERAFGLASTPGTESLLDRYCDLLDLTAQVQSVCSDIIVAARKHGITDGRSPFSIAGGAIYFTCRLLGKVKLLRDISAVAGVTEGTIRQV